MIKTKEDLARYLKADKIARGESRKLPAFFTIVPSPPYSYNSIWLFQIRYRKWEYYYNNRKNVVYRAFYYWYYMLCNSWLSKMGSEIPINCIEEGFVIWHGENIIINPKARIGKNFSISAGCCVGQAHDLVPVIQDNVEMTIGSRILGGITIAHDTTVGAGAVVVKSVEEPYTTVGGVPAKCISRNRNKYVAEKKKRLKGVIDLQN